MKKGLAVAVAVAILREWSGTVELWKAGSLGRLKQMFSQEGCTSCCSRWLVVVGAAESAFQSPKNCDELFLKEHNGVGSSRSLPPSLYQTDSETQLSPVPNVSKQIRLLFELARSLPHLLLFFLASFYLKRWVQLTKPSAIAHFRNRCRFIRLFICPHHLSPADMLVLRRTSWAGDIWLLASLQIFRILVLSQRLYSL
ncbi:hypothetical protein FH972_015831 [Carpinus fangiana]|uniref:Uncharacterized protein n=1 Tax=Carpinus fangiana TaxID=176857 RepID=A0A5N6REA3_9ROSI|nr:hypothetical protein FH972_015831 [Carpinus fangiana]